MKISFDDDNITREGIGPLSMPLIPRARGSKLSFPQPMFNIEHTVLPL